MLMSVGKAGREMKPVNGSQKQKRTRPFVQILALGAEGFQGFTRRDQCLGVGFSTGCFQREVALGGGAASDDTDEVRKFHWAGFVLLCAPMRKHFNHAAEYFITVPAM